MQTQMTLEKLLNDPININSKNLDEQANSHLDQINHLIGQFETMDQFIGGAKFCNKLLDSIVKCVKTRRNEILLKLALSDTAVKLKEKYGWNVNDQARFWNSLSVDTAKLFKPCKLPNFLYGIISMEEFSDLTNDPLADHIVNKLFEMQEKNINSAPCCKIVNGHVQCNCTNNTTSYGLYQESGDPNQTYICEDGDYITNEFDDNQISSKTAKNTPPSQSLKSLKDENFMNINITVNLDFELGEIFRVLSLRPYKPKSVNKNRSTQLVSVKDGTENESITSIKQKGVVLRRNYKKDLIKDPTTLITPQCNEEVSILTTVSSGSSLSIGDMVNLIGLIKRIVKCMVNFGVPITPGLLQQRPITMNESKMQQDYIMDHSIGFWPLVFDKRSYTQTLANIFNLAHLLKEGHLQFLPFTQEVGDKIQELLEVKTRNAKFTNTATKQKKKKRTSIYLDLNTNNDVVNDDNSLSYLHSVVNALQNRMEPVMINNKTINVKREHNGYSDDINDQDMNSISSQELTMTQAQKRSRRNKEPSITANRAVKTEFLTGENSEMQQTGILNNANNVNANNNKQSGRLNPQFFPRIHFSQLYAVTLQKLGCSNYLDINLSGSENNVIMIKEIFNNLFKRGFDDENTINNSLTLNDTVNDNVNINNLELSQNLFTSLTYNHLDLSHKEWQALHRFVKRYPII